MVGLSWVGTDNVPCVSKEDRRCKPGTIQCGTHVEEDDTGTKERERETIKTNICDRLGWVTHTRIIKTWFKKEISRIPPPPFWQKMVGWIHMLFIKWDGIFCRKKKKKCGQPEHVLFLLFLDFTRSSRVRRMRPGHVLDFFYCPKWVLKLLSFEWFKLTRTEKKLIEPPFALPWVAFHVGWLQSELNCLLFMSYTAVLDLTWTVIKDRLKSHPSCLFYSFFLFQQTLSRKIK